MDFGVLYPHFGLKIALGRNVPAYFKASFRSYASFSQLPSTFEIWKYGFCTAPNPRKNRSIGSNMLPSKSKRSAACNANRIASHSSKELAPLVRNADTV